MSLRKSIKKFIPEFVLARLRQVRGRLREYRRLRYEMKLIKAQPELHSRAIEKIRAKNGPINVVFFAIFDSVWKYDELYKLMDKDSRFNPTILVCPVVNYGRDNMLSNMEKCYNLFIQRGYNVIRSYNKISDIYVDVRKELKPDIIFYTNPYEGLIDDRYYITQFNDILTVYVSYAFPNSINLNLSQDILLHNLVWKRYLENLSEVQDAYKVSRNNAKNVCYTGYPGIDRFINKNESFSDVWKIKDKKIKRIIWAPHHSIKDYALVNYSTFLNYYDFILEMTVKYKDQIQIAFKPHPLLKNRLNILWGEEKTKEYYAKWDNLPNGMLNDSAYEDLFITSDAIIHDCGSFIGEYLFTKKPAMFLSNGIPFNKQYNESAQKCLDNYYIGMNHADIENFIKDLINGNDPIKEKREEFFNRELLPPNGKLASENIIDDIVKELDL